MDSGKLQIVGGYFRSLTDAEYMIIKKLMEEDGIKEIYKNNNKLKNTVLGGLVKYDDEYIGFFLLVQDSIDNILFVNRALKKKYQEKGIGTYILKYIVDKFPLNYYLISRTTDDNISSRFSINKVGKLIYTTENVRYYLLNKSEKEFRNSGMYEKFVEYTNDSKAKNYVRKREINNER